MHPTFIPGTNVNVHQKAIDSAVFSRQRRSHQFTMPLNFHLTAARVHFARIASSKSKLFSRTHYQR